MLGADSHATELSAPVSVYIYEDAAFGVGQSGHRFVEAMRAVGIDPQVRTLPYGQPPTPELLRGDGEIQLIVANADQMALVDGRALTRADRARTYRIGFWAWETESFPRRFDRAFEVVDEVWVGSEFVRRAVGERATVPVHTMHIPGRPSTRSTSQADAIPTFLVAFDYASVFRRKNPLGAVAAYTAAFPNEGAARLIIKCRRAEAFPAEHAELCAEIDSRADIEIIDRVLDDAEMRSLEASVSCLLSLHRSEGTGISLLDATCSGVPVIATGYSGNLDYMTDPRHMLVPATRLRIGSGADPYDASDTWSEPDLSAAAELLRTFALESAICTETADDIARTASKRFSDRSIGEEILRRLLLAEGARPWPAANAPSRLRRLLDWPRGGSLSRMA